MPKDDESDQGVDWLTSQFGESDTDEATPAVESADLVEPAEPPAAEPPAAASPATSIPPIAPFRPAERAVPTDPVAPAPPVDAIEPAVPAVPIEPAVPVEPAFPPVTRVPASEAALPAPIEPVPIEPAVPVEPALPPVADVPASEAALPEPIEPAPILPAAAETEPMAQADASEFDSVLRSARTQAELEPEPWWTTPLPSAPAEDLPPVDVPAAMPDSSAVAATGPTQASSADLDLGTTLPAPLGTTGAAASAPEAAPDAAPDAGADAAAVVPSRHSSTPTARKATRIVIWVGIAVVAVIVLVGLFLMGQRLAGTAAPVAVAAPTASATPTPTPTPTPTAEVTAMQPAGEHAWNTLFGGECLQPYASPWEENFTVSDCAAAHGAQLVYRGSFGGDAATAFPGEAALAAQMNLLCSAPGVLELGAAGAYPDLQVQGSYPITEEQWADTSRHYYCFVSRSSTEPLTTSVAGPGPTA